MLTLSLTKELTREPFKTLFLSKIESFELETLESKTEFIQSLIDALEALDSRAENQANILHWTSIFTGFSTAATIAGIGTINPLMGFFIGAVSAASAIGTISLSFVQKYQSEPVLEALRKCRIILASDTAVRWASIWQLGGTDCFTGAIKAAMNGSISPDESCILRWDNLDSLTVAINYLAKRYGLSQDEAIQELTKVKSGHVSKLITQAPTKLALPQEDKPPVLGSAPTVLQANIPTPPSQDLRFNALAALQALVDGANQSVKGGCVILAAPGAGKTTFLGTVWGRLKEKYGSDFKSLAVVVKKTDVAAFKGVSDECLCVKNSPRETAIAIIKFIDESMEHTGQVRRLFLDDFLTMQQYFDGLGTIHMNPITYKCYANSKDAIASEDLDAILLSKQLKTRLNELWLVGRQYNAALYVSSHSSNVEALPFMGSREARAVGDMIFLAKTDKRDFIEYALNNPNLIGDNAKRAAIKAQLDTQDAASNEPLMLANFNNWTLGVVPASIHDEYQQYCKVWASCTNKTVQSLEAIFKAESYKGAELIDEEPIDEIDNEDEEETTDNTSKVLEWLLSNKDAKTWVKFKGKHDRDMSFIKFLSGIKVDASERDLIISVLVERGKIELSPDGAYLRAI